MIPFLWSSIISCTSNKWAPTFFKVTSYQILSISIHREWERIPVPHDISFKIYLKFARAAKVIFVCCFRDSRGLLSREHDVFRRQTFEVWQPL